MPTVITATVVDSDSIAWANGSWVLSFTPAPGYPDVSIYNVNGVPLNPAVTSQSGVMDASGIFSLTCYTTSEVTPSGSSWVLSLSPNASVPASQYNFKTTGSSMNLSASLTAAINAPRFQARGSGAYGYADVEALVQIVYGGAYWNVVTKSVRVWDGTKFLDLVTGGSAATSNLFGPVKIASNIPATISSNQPSPTFQLSGNYWNGSASVIDSWTMTDSLGAGVNPTSTLAFTHGGTPGAVTASFPAPVLISGAANNLLISGSIAGSQTSISASGTDTNVGISLIPKGSGFIFVPTNFQIGASQFITSTSDSNRIYYGLKRMALYTIGSGSGILFGAANGLQWCSDGTLGDPPALADIFIARWFANWIAIQGGLGGASPGNLALTHNTNANVGANLPGGTLRIQGSYWTGSAGAADSWQFVHAMATGANPYSQLQISHNGSPGPLYVTLLNNVVSTSGQNQASPALTLTGTYWTGAASANDQWLLTPTLGAGTNPTSTLAITHTGSSGATLYSIASPVKITDTTAATGFNIGSLVTSGGIGCTGLYCGPNNSISGITGSVVSMANNAASATGFLCIGCDFRNSGVGGIVGLNIRTDGTGGGNVTGITSNAVTQFAGTIAAVWSYSATIQSANGSIITQAVQYMAQSITAPGSSITNAYGLYVQDLAGVGTGLNLAVYTAGTTPSAFMGAVGIGTITPKSPLHVMNLPIYTTNALAIAGGLTAGAFYRNGADPDVVMVVH